MPNKLAIVIPVYKIDFFKWTLDSIANQTCKDFTVYIGDDNSSADFENLIFKYIDRINIVYKKFNENLGRKDLVAQWNRCLDLIDDEEWIWLFSDDDIMDSNCVEFFYDELKKSQEYDLYHFNVDVINSQNDLLWKAEEYPNVLDGLTFLRKKNSAAIDSFVVEYIFRRLKFEDLGGFQHFDMAWGSDVATWAKLGKESGIKTICGARVLWRESNLNITPSKDRAILKRKLAANVEFFKWSKEYFNEISYIEIYYYMFRLLYYYSPYIAVNDYNEIVKPLFQYTLLGKIIYNTINIIYPIFKYIHRAIH